MIKFDFFYTKWLRVSLSEEIYDMMSLNKMLAA